MQRSVCSLTNTRPAVATAAQSSGEQRRQIKRRDGRVRRGTDVKEPKEDERRVGGREEE